MRDRLRFYAAFGVSAIAYVYLAFFVARYETVELIGCFSVLFLAYCLIAVRPIDGRDINKWILISILFRCIFLIAVPTLSDDFVRFVWDGNLLANGYHPFAHPPVYYFDNNLLQTSFERSLFTLVPKADHFTIYPPVLQGIFWVAVKLSRGNLLAAIIIMRAVNIVAEVGTLWVIRKLLIQFNLPLKNILLYALNPLVIVELSGNLHHEGIMIFFLMLSIYLFTKSRMAYAAIAVGLAISVKLIPLLLLPVFLFTMEPKKLVRFYALVAGTVVLTFLPMLDTTIVHGIVNGLSYYFQEFEFNASIYYLVREWGYHYYGFNIIHLSGWKLGVMSGLLILIYAFVIRRKETDFSVVTKLLPKYFVFCVLLYFLFVTNLQPWYIATLVALTIFTRYRFSIVWSFTIFLTYAGYSLTGFEEVMWITMTEYVAVLGYLAYELVSIKKRPDDTHVINHLLSQS